MIRGDEKDNGEFADLLIDFLNEQLGSLAYQDLG
jgi:hypothetical protein